jgi:hypothetical protein
MNGFFDAYPVFYRTGDVRKGQRRLNKRFEAIIAPNIHILKGASVLDIGSHDGRWSFAALASGARRVVGIEGHQHLVQRANETFETHGYSRDQYSFIVGDAYKEIQKLDPGTFDVVLCLGFFYHTIHHGFYLSEFKRINAKYIILDTDVSIQEAPIIEVGVDCASEPGQAIGSSPDFKGMIVVGRPSHVAIDMMLASYGYTSEYYDWYAKIDDWTGLEEYKERRRVTLLARRA